jgi:Ca2+-binding RTX toxin-like protein
LIGTHHGHPTNGNDILIGDRKDEIVHALAGNDLIDGKGGADQLFVDAV